MYFIYLDLDNQAVQRLVQTIPSSLFNTLSQVAGQTPGAFQGANNYAAGYSGYNYQVTKLFSFKHSTFIRIIFYFNVPSSINVS